MEEEISRTLVQPAAESVSNPGAKWWCATPAGVSLYGAGVAALIEAGFQQKKEFSEAFPGGARSFPHRIDYARGVQVELDSDGVSISEWPVWREEPQQPAQASTPPTDDAVDDESELARAVALSLQTPEVGETMSERAMGKRNRGPGIEATAKRHRSDPGVAGPSSDTAGVVARLDSHSSPTAAAPPALSAALPTSRRGASKAALPVAPVAPPPVIHLSAGASERHGALATVVPPDPPPAAHVSASTATEEVGTASAAAATADVEMADASAKTYTKRAWLRDRGGGLAGCLAAPIYFSIAELKRELGLLEVETSGSGHNCLLFGCLLSAGLLHRSAQDDVRPLVERQRRMLTADLLERLPAEGARAPDAWHANWDATRARRVGRNATSFLGEAHIHVIANRLRCSIVVCDQLERGPLLYARMMCYEPGWKAQREIYKEEACALRRQMAGASRSRPVLWLRLRPGHFTALLSREQVAIPRAAIAGDAAALDIFGRASDGP